MKLVTCIKTPAGSPAASAGATHLSHRHSPIASTHRAHREADHPTASRVAAWLTLAGLLAAGPGAFGYSSAMAASALPEAQQSASASSGGPDLIVVSGHLSPEPGVPGEPMQLSAVVQNQGLAASDPSRLRACVNGNSFCLDTGNAAYNPSANYSRDTDQRAGWLP